MRKLIIAGTVALTLAVPAGASAESAASAGECNRPLVECAYDLAQHVIDRLSCAGSCLRPVYCLVDPAYC